VTQVLAPVGGPVSTALEADLREWIRKHGVAVWLDLDGHYSAFVDRLVEARAAGELDYDVRAFRGSYLALMLSLEGLAGGVEKVPMVVHLPGFNEESVRDTPLFELYAAGTRYRKSLETLIIETAAGRIRPDQIAAFTGQPGITLEAGDAWLAGLLDDVQGGLAIQLRAMQPTVLFDDLLKGGYIATRLAGASHTQDEVALWTQLTVWTGLSGSWRTATLPSGQARAGDVAFVAASWALAVEYVDDLRRAPVSELLSEARTLPRTVIDTCRVIAAHLRERHADFYERTSDETEALLADEVDAANAEDLGKIDTFRFEEDKVLQAALSAISKGDWGFVADWAARRVDPALTSVSFWVGREPSRRSAWRLIHDATRLGQAIARAGDRLVENASLDAALDGYTERGAAVDQAHRHLEQRRAALLYPQLPEFESLRARLDDMRRAWRQWADAWARDFNNICRAHGFVPDLSYRQRMIFDEVVRPMTMDAGPTAYFVVDAFRYEMGEELYRHIADTPATTAQLKARLAELPTVTEVGMNVLAPVVSNGRLRPSLSTNDGGSLLGFSTGGFRVSTAETRRRAMHDRVGGIASPWLTLEDVVDRDSASLKRAIAQARLVVVHNREIDSAGEAGVGPAVFEDVILKLRAAWHLLREAGVRRFVFTSDHGFLLLSDGAAGPLPHGRRIDPKRRHVLSPIAADHAGEVRVRLVDLGYDGVDGHLMFPETTAVFDTGKRPMGFVHGGNSLQERVIPVLTVVHRTAAGGSTLRYAIRAAARDDVAGMHCLQVEVDVFEQGALDFGSAREIELSLRAVDAVDVQVELCQTRGKARLDSGAVQAVVGESFELFFRLSGATDARARVELHHTGAITAVQSCSPDVYFTVAAFRSSSAMASSSAVPSSSREEWLQELPDGGVRQVFAHLAAHGTLTEQEAAVMVGGARGLRRFALEFDMWVQKAPWGVRIDVVSGVKRYVREGGSR
jgi:hypothetical protein